MNEVLNQLHARKSVRVYENRPIGEAEKAAILEAALQAPTAGNMALYTILDITDPELKQTGSGVPYIKFTIAWSKKVKEVEKKCFLRCTAWRSTAEMIAKYFVKGQEIADKVKASLML